MGSGISWTFETSRLVSATSKVLIISDNSTFNSVLHHMCIKALYNPGTEPFGSDQSKTRRRSSPRPINPYAKSFSRDMNTRCFSTTSIGHSTKSPLLPSRRNNKQSKPSQITLIWIQLRYTSLSRNQNLNHMTTHPSSWYARHHKPHLRIGLKSPRKGHARQLQL